MTGWKKAAMVLGMGMSLISMPNAGAKEPPALPDTPDKIAEFLLSRITVKKDPNNPDSPARDIVDPNVYGAINAILAKRFSCLHTDFTKMRPKWTLYDNIRLAIIGIWPEPPYEEIRDRYVIGSSCYPHACSIKGLLIFDKRENDFAFALLNEYRWYEQDGLWKHHVQNGLISIFVRPKYPSAELSSLESIAQDWSSREFEKSKNDVYIWTGQKASRTFVRPFTTFYGVDCSAR